MRRAKHPKEGVWPKLSKYLKTVWTTGFTDAVQNENACYIIEVLVNCKRRSRKMNQVLAGFGNI